MLTFPSSLSITSRLFAKFDENARLGLAGGYIHEESNGVFRSRAKNSTESVAHAVQLFRRPCFEAVGGYIPLPYGGPDWVAEIIAARTAGASARFRNCPLRHYGRHRPQEGLYWVAIGKA